MDAETWRAQISEAALNPELPVIDAHHHIWPEVFAPGYETYPDDALIADVQSSGHNIIATVAVEAHGSYRTHGPVELRPVGETEHAQALAERVPGLCAGIVAQADLLLGDAVVPVLEAHFAAAPARLRGIRHITAYDPDLPSVFLTRPGLMAEPGFRAGFKHLSRHHLSFDVWVVHSQLAEVLELAQAFPETQFILDHVGGPIGIGRFAHRRAEAFAEWRAALAPFAACPNIAVKLGGLHIRVMGMDAEGLPRPRTSKEMAALHRDHILTAIDVFGPERAMFESNFPVDRMSTPYDVLWNAFKRITAGFTPAEREALFAGTARRIYRL